MSRFDQQSLASFPKPGPALKGVLITIAAIGLLNAMLTNWVPGGGLLFELMACNQSAFSHFELWRLFTAGLLTTPTGRGAVSSFIFTLVGLYFLSPDLESRWGAKRFVGFLAIATVAGNLLALVFDRFGPSVGVFHPPFIYGASAAITALTVAWARENSGREVRLFFTVAVKGQALFWFAVAYAVLGLVFFDEHNSGAIAPFGGIVTGLLFAGTPSPMRRLVLQFKLRGLEKQSQKLTAQSILDGRAPKPKRPRSKDAPDLRIVQGGIDDDDLSGRKPPKDKRYLN